MRKTSQKLNRYKVHKYMELPVSNQVVIKRINEQKTKINNSTKYSQEEKFLIMRGLDMARDMVWESLRRAL